VVFVETLQCDGCTSFNVLARPILLRAVLLLLQLLQLLMLYTTSIFLLLRKSCDFLLLCVRRNDQNYGYILIKVLEMVYALEKKLLIRFSDIPI